MRLNPSQILFRLLLSAVVGLPASSSAEGIPDEVFSGDGRTTVDWQQGQTMARAVAVQPDGKVLLAGSVGTASNLTDFGIARLLPDGTLDSDFGNSGGLIVPINELVSGQDDLQALALDASGRIHLLGTAAASGGAMIPAMARLTATGDLDTTFGDQGVVRITTWPWVGQCTTWVAIGHQGGFLFGGMASPSPTSARGPFLVRLDADGAVDTAFGDNGWRRVEVGAGHLVGALAVDPAGRILVASVNSTPTPDEIRIYRFTVGGDLDLTYGGGDGIASATPAENFSPSSLALDPVDGSLVVGLRNALEQSTPATGAIARFDATGVFDAGFGWVETTYDEGSTIEEVVVQGDRKIVGVGRINGPGAQLGGLLFVRLLPDGSFDPTFDSNGRIRVEIDLAADELDGGLGLTLDGGRALGAGFAREGGGDLRFAAVRLTTALIFSDGFESGGPSYWSVAVP